MHTCIFHYAQQGRGYFNIDSFTPLLSIPAMMVAYISEFHKTWVPKLELPPIPFPSFFGRSEKRIFCRVAYFRSPQYPISREGGT